MMPTRTRPAVSALAIALALLVSTAALFAAPATTPSVWRTEIGQEITGELSGVYGAYILITSKTQTTLTSVAQLDTPSLDRVAAFLAQQPAQPALWKDSSSAVSRELRKKLQVLQGEKLVAFDHAQRPEPEFYLVYFSAHWCGPCRRFTPQLRETYAKMRAQPTIADRFELIFISSDHGSREQRTYAQEAAMPWPMVGFNHVGSVGILERLKGNGIPCLVVVNRHGHLLFHSYKGEEYLGPDDPLEKFNALLDQIDPEKPETKFLRHRLAVRQRILEGANADLPPKPYMLALERSHYADLPVKTFKVLVSIDENGNVTDARPDSVLSAVSEAMLVKSVKSWLFLPAIAKGAPIAKTAAIPLSF
jgi:nucleoredoxin